MQDADMAKERRRVRMGDANREARSCGEGGDQTQS